MRKPILSHKKLREQLLLVFALMIGLLSLLYTNYLARLTAESERRNAELWALSTKLKVEVEDEHFLDFLTDVQNKYTRIPAIITDDRDAILSYKGLDSTKTLMPLDKHRQYDTTYFKRQLAIMHEANPPIVLKTLSGEELLVYYKDSELLSSLKHFPYGQLTAIGVFFAMAYFSFSSSRRSEQNQVWVGLAKETAHQLGTPISAMLAWVEILKEKYGDTDGEILSEIEKDVARLEVITERFSKVGSAPILEQHSVMEVLGRQVDYLEKRTSKRIRISLTGEEATARLSPPLFDWVVENICKNAVNAIGAKEGSITLNVSKVMKLVYIDITDTGGGIPKSKFEEVFEPGYTTRLRGWGLGLSLTRRIVENYHKGQVFVKESEIGKGSTFRIVLNA